MADVDVLDFPEYVGGPMDGRPIASWGDVRFQRASDAEYVGADMASQAIFYREVKLVPTSGGRVVVRFLVLEDEPQLSCIEALARRGCRTDA